jgi:hypothetical protein
VKIELNEKALISGRTQSVLSRDLQTYILLGIWPKEPISMAYRELGFEYSMELSEL